MLLLAGLAAALEVQTVATPLGKVVQLLDDLKKQVEQDGATETELVTAFNKWCDEETYATKATIGDARAKVADLQAFIQEQTALQDRLRSEVDEVVSEITSTESDLTGAKQIRDKEHGNYKQAETQFVDSLDELTRAIEVLQNPAPSFVQAANSVQRALERAMSVTPQQQASISDFFAQASKQGQQGQGQSAAFLQQAPFQSKTGELVKTLDGIKQETAKNRDTQSKEEVSAQHAFELLQQSLNTQITSSNKDKQSKQQQISQSEESVAVSQGELDAKQRTLAEDTKYVGEITMQCQNKALEWKSRTKLRSDEITALTEAIQLLSSDAGKAVQSTESNKRATSALQLEPELIAPGFTQVRRAVTLAAPVFLQTTLTHLDAEGLLAEARAAAASGAPDPFSKVRKMVNEMIQRLMQEAADEAEHKGWCDTEMGKSEAQKTAKAKEVKSAKSKIQELSARVAQLTEEIAQLTQEMSEAEANRLEAEKVRQGQAAQALVALKEYEDAQALIQNAVTVLNEFYQQRQGLVQLDATVTVEQDQDPSGRTASPDTFAGEYQAKDASGVIGILEISMADFARLESETKTAESQGKAEYDKLKHEGEVRKATMSKDLEYKQAEKQKLEGDLQREQGDLSGFEQELQAVEAYIEKLTPSCTVTADSHEVRKEKREQQIKALQEAIAVLNGDAI